MDPNALADEVDTDETLLFWAPLRGDGSVGVTDERVLVDAPDRAVSVPLENVGDATVQSFDWFLGVLSLALAAFGVLSLDRDVLIGSGFVVAGLASLYWTYHKRGHVHLHALSRAKPVSFYLSRSDSEEFLSSLEDALEGLDREGDAAVERSAGG